MIIKESDRFDVIGHNIQYLIDSIENRMVYYHTIGEFHTNPKSEIMSLLRFNEMLEYGIIRITK